MPAAASESTPRKVFGQSLANRRCSERRVVIGRLECSLEGASSCPDPASADRAEADSRHPKACSLKGSAARRKASNLLEPPGVGTGSPGATQRPDGTNRRHELAELANGRRRLRRKRKPASRYKRHGRGRGLPWSDRALMRRASRCDCTPGACHARCSTSASRRPVDETGKGFWQRRHCYRRNLLAFCFFARSFSRLFDPVFVVTPASDVSYESASTRIPVSWYLRA
jgi:hypothetical protein